MDRRAGECPKLMRAFRRYGRRESWRDVSQNLRILYVSVGSSPALNLRRALL
jgi:hypothetical protein